MSTARFSLAGFASKVFETETWLRVVSDCFGVRSAVKSCSEGQETKWEIGLKRQQQEAHSLCHHAIHKLIPMAGVYQMSMLEAVSQANSVYAPAEAEIIFHEGNKAVEEISGHVTGILYNAGKLREANREANKMQDVHTKAIMYHNSVMPYIDTLRFHIDKLNNIIGIA